MRDVEKLIFCVQIRPAIYNHNSQEYTDRKAVDLLWEEVAKEMNLPVSVCKAKWCILRNSYGRHLRNEKKIASGLASKKRRKVWHLAESMSFLKDFLARPPPKKRDDLNGDSSNDESVVHIPHPSDQQVSIENKNEPQSSNHEGSPVNTKQRVAGIDKLAYPMVEYFKKKSEKTESEDENLTFFRSLLPDIKELSSRRQRQIKQDFLTDLNKLLDEQEKEFGFSGINWESLEEEKKCI